ncbi:MAG: endonuclease, partial [Ruminococcaceae bacterium]|nr:endonuclease [Oscillospiraceae bacterium]
MRVATFNIQHCHDWVGDKIDIEFFADAIKRFDADFCGLNEVRGSGAIPGYTDQTNKL